MRIRARAAKKLMRTIHPKSAAADHKLELHVCSQVRDK
jgi:hypothetical protein